MCPSPSPLSPSPSSLSPLYIPLPPSLPLSISLSPLYISLPLPLSYLSPLYIPLSLHTESISTSGGEEDEDGFRKRKKPRTAFSREQVADLEKKFQEKKYLSSAERGELAEKLKLSDMQVKLLVKNYHSYVVYIYVRNHSPCLINRFLLRYMIQYV